MILVLACFSLAGLAGQQAAAGGAQDKAVTLAYQFPEGKVISYHGTSAETQNMDVMGQSISTRNTSTTDFSVKPKGLKDANVVLGVTMDAFKVNIESPQGNMAPDTSTVVGKSFEMVLSKLGKVIEITGASAIQYSLAESGKRNIAAGFQAFFPDLPDQPVKIGDAWQSEDMVNDKNEASDIRIALKNEHKVDGFETIDGYECARIKTTSKGTLTGAVEQSGTTLTLDASVQGTQTWYFAIKEGLYVRGDEKSSIAGKITADAANLTIPITGESTGETRLLKK
jgi:hypothetical protein